MDDTPARFDELTASFDAEQWRWLAAIAAEELLPRATLARLVSPRDPSAWLAASIGSGLLVSKPELSVAPAFCQLALRRVAELGILAHVADETRALLEARSVSHVALALQSGDLEAFERTAEMRRLPRQLAFPTAATWLRECLCQPFDAEWMERTFGHQTRDVVERVLRESLEGPSACDALYAWARAGRVDDGLLAQHAALRGEPMGETTHEAYGAVACFIEGDLVAAQLVIDRAFEGALRGGVKRSAFASYGALGPVLALLLHARNEESARGAARRLLSAGSSEAERGVSRAFRTLERHLVQPSGEQRRIDIPRTQASPWEILLSAFTVHLHVDQSWTRAGWAQHLARSAIAWNDAGYRWLARQAVLLAKGLDAEYAARELAQVDASSWRVSPRELSLWDLLSPKPEWQKTLEALAEVSESESESLEVTRRVAWYVDMTDGSFRRPALQEHRSGSGFGHGQRTSIAELYPLRDELPPEDQRILACSREYGSKRELTAEAYEMLIGHPRVFDGTRGNARVEVVRGTCRVETVEEAGYLRVVVEPPGAKLGVQVFPEGESRLVVVRVTPVMQRVIELLPEGARFPKTHEAEVLRVLGKLAESVEVRSPQLAAERTVEADPTPCLRIAPRSGAWMVQLGVRPFGTTGRFFVAGMGRASVSVHEDGQRLRCTRDLDLERARVSEVVSACPTLAGQGPEDSYAPEAEDGWTLDLASVLALLSELAESKVHCNLEWPESTALRLGGKVSSRTLHARLRRNKGWYLATGSVRLDDVTEIALGDLARAPALGNGRFIRLENGDYLEVEERIRSVVAALSALPAKRNAKELAIHPGADFVLRELSRPGSCFETEGAAEWLGKIESAAVHPVPANLRAELRPYQVDGYRWLRKLGGLELGACLADDMGLGKTVQIIALLLARAEGGPALVVAPTSVTGNWVRELRRFAPSLVPLEYAGKDRAAALASVRASPEDKVLICSYALLQQDEAELTAEPWHTAVLDEAQFIKNAASLRAQSAFRIEARCRIAATGTPVENHYGDLWSIFHFLNPGLLGEFPAFKRKFVNPLETGATDHGTPHVLLRKLVQPYVLRRRKSEVATELPELTEVQHDVRLSDDDALRYALLRKKIHDKLFTAHGRRSSKLEILAEITRLRRFCCHPRLVFPDAPAESAKIDALLELVSELHDNGHRALVFSQYVDFLSLVREQLDERHIEYTYLDGSTPAADRPARVDAFQRGETSLFLISLKAGGFGLNLTAADYVIHLDPWWNPAVEAQATDRAHRIGQDRKVTVYRLVTRDTIEEQIVALHAKKQRLARSLLDGEKDALTTDELAQLLE
ncbi:MAG: SNF2-related protein [Polyangiales bacterium]